MGTLVRSDAKFRKEHTIQHGPDAGKLMYYAWPGGYPMFYLNQHNEVICPDCANDTYHHLVAADANWEDPHLYCDHCSQRIESAYAEEEA